MPKLSGNIAHIRTPKMKVSAELQGRMFGKAGRNGSVGRAVKEIVELDRWGNDYTKSYKRPVASWAEERLGVSPKDLDTREKLDANFTRNKVGFAEEVAERLWNPELNGMMSREVEVPSGVAERYGEHVRRNPFGLYFDSMLYGRKPYEHFLVGESAADPYFAGVLKRYRSARPTWTGWAESGVPLEYGRIREYGRIYDSMTPEERVAVEEFVSGAELPIESAVQMMSPEYYDWMRQTGTPIYDIELLRNAGEGRYVPADRLGNGKQSRYLRDMDYADSGLHVKRGFNGRSPEYDVRYVERELPARASGRLLPTDIVGMQNNVQYGGTQYPYATRFYPGGGDGSLLVSGYTGGTNFGTWNPDRARGYAQSSSFGVGGKGRRLAYTVGGRPLIGVDKIEHTSDRIWGPIARYTGRNGEMIEISPELANDEVIGFIRGDGYGYFGDLSDQNQFVFGPGSSVKSLVGGSGNFDYRSPNIYERRGGTVEQTRDTARLARLFGFDGRRGAF